MFVSGDSLKNDQKFLKNIPLFLIFWSDLKISVGDVYVNLIKDNRYNLYKF